VNAKRLGDLAERVEFRVCPAVLNPADKLLEQARIGRKRVLRKTLGGAGRFSRLVAGFESSGGRI
jgi:hypothetical protein